MKIYKISLLSLRRKLSKTVFLITGLVLSVSSVIALRTISQSVNKNISVKMDEYGANILIVPKTDELQLDYGGMNISGVSYGETELNDDDAEKIKSIKHKENLGVVSPKLISIDSINNKRALVIGINFKDELRLKKWWKIDGQAPGSFDEVIIGSELSHKLSLKTGQMVLLKENSFRISGILTETGSQDDKVLFMDLREAKRIYNRPASLSLIEVSALCYNCPIEGIVSQLSTVIPTAKVTAIKQTIATKMNSMHRFEHFSLGISVLILLFCILIAVTNISSTVNDRRREIGVFRAIGFRQFHIMKFVLTEVFFSSFVAGLIGYFLGIFISRFTTPLLSMSSDVIVEHDLGMLFLAVGLSCTVGFV